jgi:DNA-binding NarL/FixJ family response regulator
MNLNQRLVEEDHLKQLTARELEVLKHVVMGKSNPQIADELALSAHTIKAHVCSILHKMSVDDRVQAAVKAVRSGIIE